MDLDEYLKNTGWVLSLNYPEYGDKIEVTSEGETFTHDNAIQISQEAIFGLADENDFSPRDVLEYLVEHECTHLAISPNNVTSTLTIYRKEDVRKVIKYCNNVVKGERECMKKAAKFPVSAVLDRYNLKTTQFKCNTLIQQIKAGFMLPCKLLVREFVFTHYLKPSNSTSLPKHIVIYDTETYRYPFDNDGVTGENHKLRLGWAYYMKLNKNGKVIKNKDKWFNFVTKDEFFDFIENVTGRNEPVYIFAHNMKYDFPVVGAITELPKRGHTVKRNMIADTVFLLDTWKDENHYIWLDTMNYARDSLANIGKAIGIKKTEPNDSGHIDPITGERVWTAAEWNDISDEDMIKYCKNDVIIVKEFLLKWLRFIQDMNLGKFCKTIASQGMESFKHDGMPTKERNKRKKGKDGKYTEIKDIDGNPIKETVGKIVIHDNEKAIETERLAKHGGRSEAFFIGDKKGRFYLLDFTSQYPYIMANKKLPIALIKTENNPSIKDYEKIAKDTDKVVILDAIIRLKEPIIPIYDKKKGKLIFPIGIWQTGITSPEIELLNKTGGEIIKINQMNVYHAENSVFTRWVMKIFNARIKFRQQGNDVYQYMCKILLNSLSGKFGQESEGWETVKGKNGKAIDIPPDELGWYHEIVNDDLTDTDRRIKVKKMLGHMWVKDGDKSLGMDSALFMYDFITAYGRVMYYSMIRIAGHKESYYGDTDGLVVSVKGKQRLDRAKQINHGSNKVLGMLEIERVLSGISIKGSKDYVLTYAEPDKNGDMETVKLKGIRKNAEKVEKDTFRQQKWLKPASLVNEKINEGMRVVDITKHLKRGKEWYNKGVVGGDGWVTPHYGDCLDSSIEVTCAKVQGGNV